MITKNTAREIACAYSEIENAQQLLESMDTAAKNPDSEPLRDVFGRPRNSLELGIPSGESSHRIYSVRPELARACIVAHIANKKALLVELNERAKIEIITEEAVQP